jgi:flagellin
MRTSAIGKTADYVGGSTYDSSLAVGQQGEGVDGNAITAGNLTLAVGSGEAVSVVNSIEEDAAAGLTASSAYAKVQAINASGISGLTATADTTAVFAFTTVTEANYNLTINGEAIYTNEDASSATGTNISGSELVDAINARAADTGVTASLQIDAGVETVALAAADGRDIIISENLGAGVDSTTGLGDAAGDNNVANAAIVATDFTAGATAAGSIRLTSTEEIVVGGSAALIGYAADSYALGTEALNSISVTTVDESNTAITRIDAALTAVNAFRSTFGSIQNRFESTIANIETSVENLSASRSRIQDADFAAETAALTRAQILQQAGVAMLSQANAQPQNVLALLQ